MDPDNFYLAADDSGPIQDREARPGVMTFFWNARQDLVHRIQKPVSLARLRVRAAEEGHYTDSLSDSFIEPFIAGNEPPEILSIRVEDTRDAIPISVTMKDSTGDRVTLEAFYAIGGKGSTPTMVEELKGKVFTTLMDGGGIDYPSFWDTRADGQTKDLTSDEIVLEIVPFDMERGKGLAVKAALENNSPPAVEVIHIAASSDRSFHIPIRYIASNEEKDPVAVVLQWSAENQPSYPELNNDDRLNIEALAARGAKASRSTRVRDQPFFPLWTPRIHTPQAQESEVQIATATEGFKKCFYPGMQRAVLVIKALIVDAQEFPHIFFVALTPASSSAGASTRS